MFCLLREMCPDLVKQRTHFRGSNTLHSLCYTNLFLFFCVCVCECVILCVCVFWSRRISCEHKKERILGCWSNAFSKMCKKNHVLSHFSVLIHGCEGKQTTWATCVSNDMCSLREALALMNKAACKSIVLFPIVISLRGFFFVFFCPFLCVLVKIDKHPRATKWHEVLAWIIVTNIQDFQSTLLTRRATH